MEPNFEFTYKNKIYTIDYVKHVIEVNEKGIKIHGRKDHELDNLSYFGISFFIPYECKLEIGRRSFKIIPRKCAVHDVVDKYIDLHSFINKNKKVVLHRLFDVVVGDSQLLCNPEMNFIFFKKLLEVITMCSYGNEFIEYLNYFGEIRYDKRIFKKIWESIDNFKSVEEIANFIYRHIDNGRKIQKI